MPKLAIVIPAFKNMYFEKALVSITRQTCTDFTVYIGDDASPYDLRSIADGFKDKLSIVYKRFDINLGGSDLVAQWERCLEMVKDEEWIWLFSDDDIMDENCVKSFYRSLDVSPDFDVFHFNVHTINQDGNIISSFSFPGVLTCEEYFYGRYNLGYHSFVIEYIFRLSHFKEMGGFEHFDLGWGTDDALWIKLSKRKGIKTIDGPRVSWRKSPYNISPNYKDKAILCRKFSARIAFASWAIEHAELHDINIEEKKLHQMLERVFVENLMNTTEILSFKMIRDFLVKFYTVLNKKDAAYKKVPYLYIYKVYRFFVNRIKNTFGPAKGQKEAGRAYGMLNA
jgi:glycosyltransferase involved in cell wall biosynthesis